jgi:hypothetical protein
MVVAGVPEVFLWTGEAEQREVKSERGVGCGVCRAVQLPAESCVRARALSTLPNTSPIFERLGGVSSRGRVSQK